MTITTETAHEHFPRGTGYLAACTGGLPTAETRQAMLDDIASWSAGRVSAVEYGTTAERARAAFARVVGVDVSRVSIGSQTSAMVSVIAASVPDGAQVLCVDTDFSSIIAPFMQQAHRGVVVEAVPLADLASSITNETWLVAYSLIQSATGEVADDDALVAAAKNHDCRMLVDLTQAAGVHPVTASRYDATVTHAYKWLCSPRGVAFATYSESFAALVRPIQAGWYAGLDVWASCYGSDFPLATDARRFDVSPAWQAFAGALPSLELFARLDARTTWSHACGLGDALCRRLGIPTQNQAIITWPDIDGHAARALTDAGLTVSGRAGRVRVAFHLWNDLADVDRVVSALHAAGVVPVAAGSV